MLYQVHHPIKRRLIASLIFFFGILLFYCSPLSASDNQNASPEFIATLDALTLSPEDRDFLMNTESWIKELATGMDQKEADAVIKLLKNPGRMKFATMAPMGTVWAKFIREVPKDFEKKSGGIIGVDSYIGLSLGNDPDYVRKMASGALESAGLTSWGMKYISKEMGVYELPFIFETYGEADYVMEKTWPYFVEKFREKGFYLIPAKMEVGFLQIFSTSIIAKKPEDLTGTKYGSWMGPVEITTMQKLGVNPVVITVAEVPSSLATNIIQTGSAMTMYMIGAQLMNFVKQGGGCSGINMFYPPGGLVLIRKSIENAALMNVPKGDRKYLSKYVDKGLEIYENILVDMAPNLARELREGNKILIDNLQKKGMQLYIPTKEERDVWKKATRPLWDEMAGKQYSREILDLVLKHKADYRAAHPDEFENYVWTP
ncbi:MAG: TRAP transporter substrate-binding protein DctP [Proteobacteria bacterium]|nr:TRAP transporter substrate-binding protein DctP [Pseudomonadota bacterium]